MSDGPKLEVSDGYEIAGAFPSTDSPALLLAPTTAGKEKNVLRMPLIPLACWRMDELWFDFDSSFIRPESVTEFAELAGLRAAFPGSPLSVFGHADPTGDDAYNERLSGRRAEVVYALLIRDTARWESLYSKPAGGDNWGMRSIQVMLKQVGHDPGPADGVIGAVQDFQRENKLTDDGDSGPKTREKLSRTCMDTICLDEANAPFLITKGEFLGKGQDSGGMGSLAAARIKWIS